MIDHFCTVGLELLNWARPSLCKWRALGLRKASATVRHCKIHCWACRLTSTDCCRPASRYNDNTNESNKKNAWKHWWKATQQEGNEEISTRSFTQHHAAAFHYYYYYHSQLFSFLDTSALINAFPQNNRFTPAVSNDAKSHVSFASLLIWLSWEMNPACTYLDRTCCNRKQRRPIGSHRWLQPERRWRRANLKSRDGLQTRFQEVRISL